SFSDVPAQCIHQLEFAPDGRTLAASQLGSGVQFWDVRTAKPRLPLIPTSSRVSDFHFTADGKQLALADGEAVLIAEAATGRTLNEFGHAFRVWAPTFTPDGKTLLTGAADDDRVIRVWDPLTGRQTSRWVGH